MRGADGLPLVGGRKRVARLRREVTALLPSLSSARGDFDPDVCRAMMAHLALADAHRLDAHSTCFGARTMAKLGRRLRALRPGAVVMTLKQVVVALKVRGDVVHTDLVA
jgi:hypothetical protein